MNAFLAFAFRDEDKELVGHVDRLLASHSIFSVTGEGLGGEQLTPAVQQRIDETDALIGLLTRRDAKVNGTFTTHQWVLDEIAYARNHGKRAIAVVEDGVDIGGMYQPHEYIQLDRDNVHLALLRVSETIGQWKRESGRTVKVQLLPEDLALQIGANGEGVEGNLWRASKQTGWTTLTPVPEGGGTFVYVGGVQDDHLIQIRFKEEGNVWWSPATSQWMQVRLTPGGKK
jgi:hypothetical protein